jgi:hypothetical protein
VACPRSSHEHICGAKKSTAPDRAQNRKEESYLKLTILAAAILRAGFSRTPCTEIVIFFHVSRILSAAIAAFLSAAMTAGLLATFMAHLAGASW